MSEFSKLIKEADEIFSKFVRQKGLQGSSWVTCFTCGTKAKWTMMDCGHFIKRDCMATRYDEDNCRPQCKECNQHMGGNLDMFEVKLKMDIGTERFKILLSKQRNLQKFARFELQEIIDKYSKLIKR